MAQRDCITILHFSDLQFGEKHRFARTDLSKLNGKFETLRERIANDLKTVKKECGLKPDLICITGDIAERGLKSEFESALEFISAVQKQTGLANDRIIIVPGNHDVNRKSCEAYFNNCDANEVKPREPYFEKWEHYMQFWKALYKNNKGITFTKIKPWTIFKIDSLKLVVAGLNSTMMETHRKDEHFGFVSEKQLKWFEQRLNTYKAKGWLRIAALHHNVIRAPINDDSNLRDANDFRRYLRDCVNIVLHGHRHDAEFGYLTPTVPIAATGSVGVGKKQRGEEIPNQYQLMRIYPDKIICYGRQFSPTQKKWNADTRISGNGETGVEIINVALEKVEKTFPKHNS